MFESKIVHLSLSADATENHVFLLEVSRRERDLRGRSLAIRSRNLCASSQTFLAAATYRHALSDARYTGVMASSPESHATVLLQAAAAGDRHAVEDLLPLVYEQLRRAAQQHLAAEAHGGAGQTLSATALVHEAYLKLVGPRQVPWEGRAHFYAAAAVAMRHLLVDRARAKACQKRGGGARRAALDLRALPALETAEESEGFLILDSAISRLEGIDAQAAAVVRLRFFAGLSVEQTAAALGISAPTVKRTWSFARAWLKDTIERQPA
jgi:RNA polymerase sigma-70 factor, ECF subfamily